MRPRIRTCLEVASIRGGALDSLWFFAPFSLLAAFVLILFSLAPPAFAAVEHKYETQITEGEPLTKFSQPWGLAFDSAGNLYVADAGSELEPGREAIYIFNPANAFVPPPLNDANVGGSPFTGPFVRGVAVANLPGPNQGIVYVAESNREVIDVFTPEGAGKFKLVQERNFKGFMYVAVDNSSGPRSGDVYVMSEASGSVGVVAIKPNGEGKLEEASTSLEPPATGFSLAAGSPVTKEGKAGLAVNAANGEVYVANPRNDVVNVYSDKSTALQFSLSGAETPTGSFEPVAVGVDSSTGEVYVVDNANHVIDEFSGRGKYEGQITEAEPETGKPAPLIEPLGVAVNSSGKVYVSDAGAKAVDVYGAEPPSSPQVESDSVSDVTARSATLNAEIVPNSESTKYHFEYGACTSPSTCATSGYEHSAPEPDAVLAAGFEVDPVSAHVQGLVAGATYHFRVLTENEISKKEGAPVAGNVGTFTTQGAGVFALPDGRQWEMVSPPEKSGALIEPIGAGATIQSAADGDAISYGTNVPTESEPPGYTNLAQVLSTRAGGSSAWESRDIAIPHSESTGVSITNGAEPHFFSDDLSLAVVQPFGSFRPCTNAQGARQLCLSEEASEQTAFLRTDYLNGNVGEPCLPASMHCYRPLVTRENATSGNPFGGEPGCLIKGLALCGPEFIDATPDLSHVVVKSEVALTVGGAGGLYEWAAGKPAGEQLQLLSVLPPNMEGKELPAGGTLGLGLPFGHASANARHALSDDGSRVFWAQEEIGSHLYMRDTVKHKTLQLDVPEPGCPSQDKCGEGVVAPEFQVASSDGSRVIFADTQKLTPDAAAYSEERGQKASGAADLYLCDIVEVAGELKCNLTDLAPGGAALGNVVGSSEDGSWVYFVANGVLQNNGVPLSGAVHGTCPNVLTGVVVSASTCNLYVRHNGETTLVAVISALDAPDWTRAVAGLPARVSPDGEWLAFMSERSLTGYDNRDAASGQPNEEVYLYDARTGRLACASCDPSGARPHGRRVEAKETHRQTMPLAVGGETWQASAWIAANVPSWTTYEPSHALYQSRYLSNSGRLFFDSSDALVPSDVNGQVDVYEYEPNGVPESAPEAARCGPAAASGSDVFKPGGNFEVEVDGMKERGEEGAGCVGLISSGTSGEESAFLDASETGGDAFFLTTAKLAPQDFDDALDVYDAHECTSAVPCSATPTSPPPCITAEGCRAAPIPQPAIFGASGSATFSGVGNLGSSPPAKVVSKSLTRAQKLAKALKACKAVKSHRKRVQCETSTRKRYGLTKIKAKRAGKDRRAKS